MEIGDGGTHLNNEPGPETRLDIVVSGRTVARVPALLSDQIVHVALVQSEKQLVLAANLEVLVGLEMNNVFLRILLANSSLSAAGRLCSHGEGLGEF